jgi:hypothetical protein
MDSAWRESGIIEPDSPDWVSLRQYAERKILNFYCVLKLHKFYEELWNEGDEGVLKLVGLLKVPNARFDERYQKALAEGDYTFLQRYMAAIQSECRLDDRVLQNRAGLSFKLFLFLNWEFPLLTPELDQGLLVLENRQICALLDKLPMPDEERVFWDSNQLKKELHKLRLRRTPELHAIASIRLSDLREFPN